jgi:hypothetical protein
MRVVEVDEAGRLKATGVWFDCPKKASMYRTKVENEIAEESEEIRSPKAKHKGNKR